MDDAPELVTSPLGLETLQQSPTMFALTIVGLIALLVLMPVVATWLFDFDSRTPAVIARDALNSKYHLVMVDVNGKPLPPGSPVATLSTFSLASGATTKDVPFRLDGQVVHCTIHVPDGDPRSVTAACPG